MDWQNFIVSDKEVLLGKPTIKGTRISVEHIVGLTREYILATLKLNKPKFEKLGVTNVGLFGSYLRNEQSSDCDIDILIDFEPGKENFDNFMEACDLFERLFSNEKVDIVTRNGLSPYIGSRILNEVVYV